MNPGPIWNSLRQQTQRWLSAGRDLLYPPNCLVCTAECDPSGPKTAVTNDLTKLFCQPCLTTLLPRVLFACRRCGAERVAAPIEPGAPCQICVGHEFRFASARALGNYQNLLREVVLRCKLAHEEALTRGLTQLLAQRYAADIRELRLQAIVPIPMHWWRRLRRGVNGPELMAQELSRQFGIPTDERTLVRGRATKPQGELAETERKKNLRHALQLRRGADYRGARVLLVDDIITTGVTLNAATKLFLDAGAEVVHVAVLARAIPHLT